ncbi:uncharacterized protein TNCT_395351 [Trichonephila clavata]|uniref:LisH domain-containing protein n=1 Tax=Trichonephila clavata TaxID=2740835 RepID=A0A8X6G5Q3_TRICU|nr:uncharacterized protein TNCT_395351 [Trichonephila clavata]
MADYYPSEIARLVLGYLKEVNCPEAWQAFLVECSDLQEHYRLLQNGRTCSTNIEGKSLLDILHEYRSLKASAQRNSGNEAHPSNLNSGASSSHVNANTSSSEIFKTPQKTNSEAFNRFRANQKSQTQATTTSIRNGQDNQSPQFSRTPNRLLVPRTPRRLQGVCVTTLNFNTDAERNETSQFTCRRSFESPRQTVSVRQPLRESSMNKRSCFSDPAKSKPQMLSRTVQTEENVNASRSSANNIDNQISSHSSSGQPFSTSGDNSQNVASVGNSNSQELKQSHRNVEFNVSSSNTTHTGDNLNTLNSLMDSNKSTNVERQSTVVNQSIVFTSTEIRTGEDSNSVTPQFETEPPPYNRAPSTNSPRIILSYDRSQITSLTTPLKDKRQWSEEFSSPRRKGTIPKRRLLNESPHPKQLISNELGVIHEDLETLIDELLANQPLAQRLADNINKVIGHDELPRDPDCSNSSSFPTLQDINNSGEIIKSILARTETDPVFNDWFPFAFNSRDCDELNTIQESAAETSEPTFSGVGGTNTTKDESIQTVFASKDETDSLKQTAQPPKQVSETETNTNQQTESTLRTHLTENIQNFTHSDQAVSHETESTKSQNATPAPNNEISKSVEETSGVNHSTEVSTTNTAPRDVLDSCMSLIRPDGDEQLQDYMFESSNVPDNANNNPSSTPASIPVIENKTMPTDTSALKPVSIGTPFQVETQMALTQSALNQNTTTPSCNSPMPISPAVQNTHICSVFNSSMPTTTLVQLPYSPMSTIVLPSSDAFRMQNSVQYRIVLPSVNWACNHATSEIIMPVQSEVNANVVHAADVNSSPIKIPADFSPTKALNLKDNVANFITVTSGKHLFILCLYTF